MSEQVSDRKTSGKPNRVPLYVGLGAALVAVVLSIAGMIKNSGLASLTPTSLVLVFLIAGGSWGIVAWAITTAVYDVEQDVAQDEETPPQTAP